MAALTDAEFDALIGVGHQVLDIFPRTPGACVMMSALYVGRLHDLGHRSARLVGGKLAIGSQVVFGRAMAAAPFSTSDLEWDGHAWVRFGEYLADVSLVQTAYSAEAPRTLAEHVTRLRKPNQRLYVATPKGAGEDDLNYVEQHVFSRKQVDLLFRSALTLLPAT